MAQPDIRKIYGKRIFWTEQNEIKKRKYADTMLRDSSKGLPYFIVNNRYNILDKIMNIKQI